MSQYDDEKSQNIAISVGIKAAAEMASAAAANNGIDPAVYFGENVDGVVGVVLGVYTKHALQAVNQALPGATVVQAPFVPPAVAVAPQAAPVAPVAAPTPIPGATDGDPETAALWQQFFADFQASGFEKWYDNRTGKTKPTQPDFKDKATKSKSLWIVGKKNPSWVLPGLKQLGLVA